MLPRENYVRGYNECSDSSIQNEWSGNGKHHDEKMSQFIYGIQHTIVNDKITRGDSLNEGKRPMSFSVYENMCKILYEGDDYEYLFAHSFLTMEWNLMEKAENCVNMHVNHVQ